MPGFGKTPPTVMSVTNGVALPGDPIAMVHLGQLYLAGRGVAVDLARGRQLVSCAAERGGSLSLRPLRP
jgi:TPR repeat protein